MIICPKCNAEIEDNSRYCDQCGQELHYCTKCGRVGLGRRCTQCGGLMSNHDESHNVSTSLSVQQTSMSREPGISVSSVSGLFNHVHSSPNPAANAMTMTALVLTNTSLGVRIEATNGAVIGRKQGPYMQYFQNNMYVSGVHAQLQFRPGNGWCIIDKHSSNGTKLNDRRIQPEVEMSLKDGDIITIANVNLQVSIK